MECPIAAVSKVLLRLGDCKYVGARAGPGVGVVCRGGAWSGGGVQTALQ